MFVSFLSRQKMKIAYDKAPSYNSKTLKNYVKYWNENPNNACAFVIQFVDPCLTSIYQPSDIMYNKPFKALIQTKYNQSTSTELINNGNINIADKCKVSRDYLINFICQIIDELN